MDTSLAAASILNGSSINFECEDCFSCLFCLFSIALMASYCFNALEFHLIAIVVVDISLVVLVNGYIFGSGINFKCEVCFSGLFWLFSITSVASFCLFSVAI